ncbi:MAG: tRNA pseudouridine(38-40) synthase TruA, partial [Spirochaetales bacterium]|nr:tRNA pseudouridine(38-40) synthase TruA [Spirochaetales bacterium]
EIEKALKTLHKGKDITLVGSGRTDSGVHASFQVAHFESENSTVPSERFRQALNSILPRDIRIMKSREVDPSFHARYDAVMRVYRYYLIKPEDQKAHMCRYSTTSVLDLDLKKMNEMAMELTGSHDFTSFAAARDPNENKVRTIHSARFYREGPYTVFRVAGNAFLWRMVRTMVGTLLQQYEHGGGPENIRDILEKKDRTLAGPSARPYGLFLDKVIYGSEKALY